MTALCLHGRRQTIVDLPGHYAKNCVQPRQLICVNHLRKNRAANFQWAHFFLITLNDLSPGRTIEREREKKKKISPLKESKPNWDRISPSAAAAAFFSWARSCVCNSPFARWRTVQKVSGTRWRQPKSKNTPDRTSVDSENIYSNSSLWY